MKAQVLHGIGDIRYEETDKPRIEKGWVLVKVKAQEYVAQIFQEYIKPVHMFIQLLPGMNFQVKL